MLGFLASFFLIFANILAEQEAWINSAVRSQLSSRAAPTAMLGAIVDCSTRVGKEEIVAMEMAIEDLYKQKEERFTLRVKCSGGDPMQAAQAARHLVKKNHAQAILGPNSWEESYAVAKISEQFNVPILSFSDCVPPWATEHWSFFIQASPSTTKQMTAAAAIIHSWGWRRVGIIYEDTKSAADDILKDLCGALQESDVQFSSLVPLPSFSPLGTLRVELENLKKGQCRVFLVHANLALAERLFKKAKEMKMIESGYVWIITDSISSLVHSMNASVISSMQGVVGVRRYFSEMTQDFHNFHERFTEVFRKKYPEEKNFEPGILALQAYDVTRTVGSAMNKGSYNGSQIIENIQKTDFLGLSGKILFVERKLAPIIRFQIVNVIGRSYRELGYWSDQLGFSPDADNTTGYNSSMEILGHVFWPGGPWTTPRGWDLPTISNPMRIGVPNGSLTNKFVNIEYDPSTGTRIFSGFSLQVFDRTAKNLKYSLPYEFIVFDGTSYTDLVKQVELKKFDAVVGDIAIISSRYDYVEFTHAHTESGLVMVVPVQSQFSRAWLFMKPFTKAMWLLTLSINIYNGFVIWTIEKNYCSELRRQTFLHRMGTLFWLAFATVFPLQGDKLHSNLSKMATVVWLFVALIITQSYTASLTSMLTVQHLKPVLDNIEKLKSENANVGCSMRSFVNRYLVEALNFKNGNIKNFTSTEAYADALRSGEIAAAFLEVPVAKLFVAKYCKSFVIAGPTYQAFPKGSMLLPDMNEALLNAFETGVLKDLEDSLLASEKCVETKSDNETASLSPQSFFVLFILTAGTSTLALAVYYFHTETKVEDSMAGHEGIWMLMLMVMKKWRERMRKFSRKVRDVECPRNSQEMDGT
ncbi:glutamate receptor 2.8-like isoform X2 [Primulina tabacum]|uniref:glutamate receptor 2.8-like isoform X2 n=1 Tax=Primulina tabacum TaxID=48773 RepID=UPI003F5934EA